MHFSRLLCTLMNLKRLSRNPEVIFVIPLVLFAAFSLVRMVHADSTKSITITSSPSTGSGYIIVDGNAVTTPATFTWNVGGNHTIAAISFITVISNQSRYVYSSWSDGGEQSHVIT